MKSKWRFLMYFIIVAVCSISLFPLFSMIIMSTKTTEEIFTGLSFIPGKQFIKNIQTVVAPNFLVAYKNSLLVSTASALLSMLFSAMAGYSLSVYRFKARNAIYAFVLITMMVPSSISMIGYMNEMRVLGLTKTLMPLSLVWLANGFGVFWMCQYITGSMPLEFIESARIDGSNEMLTFFFIVLPCIKPALGTLLLLIFLWSWNNYLLSLVLINNQANYTIPLYIQTLGNEYVNDYAAQITGLLLSILPLLIAFIIGSKTFIKGLTAGAVKG